MLIAFDDTDSAEAGCTTHVVFAALQAVPELALRSMPRLVRLNPNVPHKTRGNGAVVLDLVLPAGPRVQVGSWQGHAVHAYPDGEEPDDAAALVWDAIRRAAQPDASPAAATGDVPEILYWEAVRTEVTVDAARSLVDGHVFGDGRGIVGAAAALAWPGPATSYELLAYRDASRIGTPRELDEPGLRALDADGTTFHSGDGDVTTCVPHTPCPVLAGLRGLDPERLVDAGLPVLERGERPAGWMLFATNQASGDHVLDVGHVGTAPKWATVAVDTTVLEEPKELRGGHVLLRLGDRMGHPIDAMAFEPTKGFRATVRALRPGDNIHAVGAWDAGTLRLEKLRIDAMSEPLIKTGNPECPQCGRRMKSRGKDAGYRCPDGHGDAPEEAAQTEVEQRKVRPGWYEVPVIARRHLHRPLMFEAIPDQGASLE